MSPARSLRPPRLPNSPPTPPPAGTDAVPVSPGRCSELDVEGMQRVVGGTEARSHAWPYQVGPAAVPRPGPGLCCRRDPALSPGPPLAPSPDLPPVLLQRRLVPHLRRLPHPEELGDDRRPLRQQVSDSTSHLSFLSPKLRAPKTFSREESCPPRPAEQPPLRAFGAPRAKSSTGLVWEHLLPGPALPAQPRPAMTAVRG